jgi:hypothetical protein
MIGVEPRVYRIHVTVPGTARSHERGGLLNPVGGDIAVAMQPESPFSINNVYVEPRDNKVEIDYVQVANTILTAFASRHPICDVAQMIRVYLSNRSERDIEVDVVIEGKEVRFT